MSSAQLAIVIPVFNRADIVGHTLDSVAAQTLRPLRVVLVDNNSTDNTREVLDRWADKVSADDFQVTVISETKPGPGAARNAGLKLVDEPWTMFFDSDDLMMPDHCARAVAAAEAGDKPDIVGWDAYMNAPNGAKRYRQFVTTDMIRVNLFESIFSTQRYMARTELFRRAGGWLEDAWMGEDIELGHRLLMLKPKCVRMESQGDTLVVVPEPNSLMHQHATSLDKLKPALESIRRNMLPEDQYLVDLHYLCAVCGWAKDDAEGHRFVRQRIAAQPWPRRWLFKLFYTYGCHGGRGIGRIYRLITPAK